LHLVPAKSQEGGLEQFLTGPEALSGKTFRKIENGTELAVSPFAEDGP